MNTYKKKNMLHHKTRKGIWEEFLYNVLTITVSIISYIEIKPIPTF